MSEVVVGQHLDGLSRHTGDDVPGLAGIAVGKVLGGRDHAHQVDRQAQLQAGGEGAQHAGGAQS